MTTMNRYKFLSLVAASLAVAQTVGCGSGEKPKKPEVWTVEVVRAEKGAIAEAGEIERCNVNGSNCVKLAANQKFDAPALLKTGPGHRATIRIAKSASLDIGEGSTVVLLDCSPDVRRLRLVELRDRAELANERMENWASYLRDQAEELGIARIDTSFMSVDRVAAEVESILGDSDPRADAI